MRIKVYLNDWMINIGIVGFIKILKDNKVDNLVDIDENYIEFDTEILKKFPNYYFNYFMKENDIVKIVSSKSERVLAKIKSDDTKLKEQVKWLKEQLKLEMTKVKKIDESIYNMMKIEIDNISKVTKIEQLNTLEESISKYIELLSTEHIKERISLNRFKNNLSTYFFGQVSIYNVVNSALSYNEHLKMMYKDYILDIVESGYIHDYFCDKYNLEQLKEHIKILEDELGEKEFKKSCSKYVKIKKFLLKNHEDDKLKEYISNELENYCTFCGKEEFITTDYTEGNFVPLAMSSENALNFFYNQNARMPICSVCKLMLFCIPAGVNKVSKISRDYDKGEIVYKEKSIFNFINLDTDVETLISTNENFERRIDIYGKNDSKYQSLIIDIVHQKKNISLWELSNIFVIEFDAEYRGHSRIEYFSIQKYVAKFFVNYSNTTIDKIKNRNLKLKLIDCILKNKNIIQSINDNTRNIILEKSGFYSPYDSYLGIRIHMILKLLKKGVEDFMEKEYDKKLHVLYNIGIDLHEIILSKKEENKLTEYSYRMLNSIKSGNKNEFMDIIIRLHMCYGKDISKIFLDVMKDGDLDFETIGHSFLSGFISKRYEAKVGGENSKLDLEVVENE